jgi:hypothetical protein
VTETSALPPALTCAPVFVVGCDRSGTTLLRLMLDTHRSLALPDESHFIIELRRGAWRRRSPATTLEKVLAHDRFKRWGLDPAHVRRLAEIAPPRSFDQVMRVVFAAYAAAHGKPRWGDKSPPYVAHVPVLAELFPDAQFIHIIRDGREVAVSLAERRWGPTTPVAGASWWRARVQMARSAGARLGSRRYLEVRLEELIAAPADVLARVCDFLGEPYDRSMMDYHHTARTRVWSSPRDPAAHRHVSSPPTLGLRDWRAGLTAGQQRAVEAAAQPLLAQLGYGGGPVSPASALRVHADRIRRLPLILARDAGFGIERLRRRIRRSAGD